MKHCVTHNADEAWVNRHMQKIQEQAFMPGESTVGEKTVVARPKPEKAKEVSF